ncbi:putative pectinesterase/pectinesterase inhibitor 13 [Abeliophyllum distichum]|uniref:Pectinesterase n=1 Tax=Abeliophyllum distichum TaxID=126358 RepID=A0ABD1RW57_9LAMI
MTLQLCMEKDPKKSIITGSKNFVEGCQHSKLQLLAKDSWHNLLDSETRLVLEKHQAVALRVQADRSVFLHCRMEGYQDTLYAQTHRQFYRSCYITGTVDFIFGDAAAIFQNCMIYAALGTSHDTGQWYLTSFFVWVAEKYTDVELRNVDQDYKNSNSAFLWDTILLDAQALVGKEEINNQIEKL